MKFDAEELIRMARDLDALLSEVGGPDEVREFSADLSDDPGVGTDDDSDETFFQKVQRQMRRAGVKG